MGILYPSYCMMRLQDVCVHCLKYTNLCGLKICGGVKPNASCGKLIFLLAVHGLLCCIISWQANIKRDKPSEHIGSAFPCMGGQVRSVWYFLWGDIRIDNTFSAQFPLNVIISHLRKTFQSSLSTVLLIDLLPGCQVLTLSRHVCSPLFIPVRMFSSVQPLGTAPVRFPDPLQKALFTVRGLREPTLLKASQDSWEERCGAGKSYKPHKSDNTDVFRCS